MKTIAVKILQILTPGERLSAAWLGVLMAGLAVIEVTGILSIAPFLSILGNPDAVYTNRRLNLVYTKLGFHDAQTFLLAAGAASFVILVGASIFRALVQHAKFYHSGLFRHEISSRLMRNYIRQPYAFFLGSNSSQISNNALQEVDHFISNGLMPSLQLISSGFVIFAVALLLVAVSPQLAFTVAGVLSAFYVLAYLRFGKKIGVLGQQRRDANILRYQITSEIFGGIKELKVLGRENVYLEAYDRPSLRFAKSSTLFQSLSELPRYAIETLGFCSLFIVVFYTVRRHYDLGHSLPLIGLYAFAGYRLLPAVQNFYGALTALRYCLPSVQSLHDDLAATVPPAAAPELVKIAAPLYRDLTFDSVYFTYPGTVCPLFENLSVVLPAGASIGVVGPTGAGKSTFIDLILGLLSPDSGAIRIDGMPLTDHNRREWQMNIGYVPQTIFLADDTVARNIAFGIIDSEIDREAVEVAAHLAQLHDFVVKELPSGYDTGVGERGVRLSGGQRQRLGIARALYHNPDVLIFDEATSALDAKTESDVISAIETLFGKKTIIMIAHRQETLRKCTHILRVDRGIVKLSTRGNALDITSI